MKQELSINPNDSNYKWLVHAVQHYNPQRYWRYRDKVIDPNCPHPKWCKLLMLLYIKRCDAYNNASMGTNINQGAHFDTPPILPHGLNGIIIHYKASFGKNCTIYQQVTIGGKDGKAATIGDNVSIGAGAKIIGGVHIGNNVVIGANTVVTKDIPDNKTVVGAQMRIL